MRNLFVAAISAMTVSVAVACAGPVVQAPMLVYASIPSPGEGDLNPNRVADLFVIRADGTRLRRLTRTSWWEDGPVWSPDGSRIAFSKGDPICHANSCQMGVDFATIWVMGVNGGSARQLTQDPEREFIDGSPTWSPDGTKIAFAHSGFYDESDKDGIYTVGADGRDVKRIAGAHPVRALDWSRDGSTIAYLKDFGTAGLVDVATGRVTRLSFARTLQGDRADVAWSPTGRKLAFATGRGVYVVGSKGGRARRVGKALRATGVAWSPDGRRLAYSAGAYSAGDIFVIGLNGRGLTRVTRGRADDYAPHWRP